MALMKYPLMQCLAVWENSNVEQIIGMASKMIGAIGSTYSARKEGIDKGTKLRVFTAVVTPTLTYTDVKLGLYRQGTRDTYRLCR